MSTNSKTNANAAAESPAKAGSVPPALTATLAGPARLVTELRSGDGTAEIGGDQTLVHIFGSDDQVKARVRPGFFSGWFGSPRRLVIRTSLLDRGSNVVEWETWSRIEPTQGPEASRIRIRVRGWVSPGGVERFAAFVARHPRLQETLEQKIESAFMERLPQAAEAEPLPLPVPTNPGGQPPRSNPRNYAAQLERRLALSLLESLPANDTGFDLRCAVSLPEIPPVLSLMHSVELQLKGPGHVQLRLNTTIQLRLLGHDGVVKFLKSGVTDLSRWCRESVEHVIKHNTFGNEMLAFLSALDETLLPQFEEQLRHEAEHIGYEVTSIISEPVDKDGKVPDFYAALKHLTLEGRPDFETSDPVVKVRLGYAVGCRLRSLTATRVQNAIHRGARLDQVIHNDLVEAIKRVVETKTPQEAYGDFEQVGANGEPPLKELVHQAIIDTLALYHAEPNEIPGPKGQRIPAVTVRREENRIGILWRSLNNLQVRVESRYESASNVLVRARIEVDLRVDSIAQNKSRESWTNGFLQFLRFMPAEESGGRIDSKAVAEFIAEKIRSHLDGRFSTLSSTEFLAYMVAVRRDYFGEIPLPAAPDAGVDHCERFKNRLENWINDFCAREFGLGVRVANCLIHPSDAVVSFIGQRDQAKFGLLQGDTEKLQTRIREIGARLVAEREFLTPEETAKLEAEQEELTQRLLDQGMAQALTSRVRSGGADKRPSAGGTLPAGPAPKGGEPDSASGRE